jgi:hypothetical protein
MNLVSRSCRLLSSTRIVSGHVACCSGRTLANRNPLVEDPHRLLFRSLAEVKHSTPCPRSSTGSPDSWLIRTAGWRKIQSLVDIKPYRGVCQSPKCTGLRGGPPQLRRPLIHAAISAIGFAKTARRGAGLPEFLPREKPLGNTRFSETPWGPKRNGRVASLFMYAVRE